MEKAIYNSEVFGINGKIISNISKICAVLLALCPVLQHYKGIYFNAGVVAIISVVPFLTVLILGNLRSIGLKALSPVLPMIICQIYIVINHGTSVKEIGEAGVYIVYLIAIVMGCIDFKSFLKATSCIAFIACAAIMLQYICYYVLGFHLKMVPTDLLISSADVWILNANTGLANIRGVLGNIYRPSAFFLEPSHAYLYIFPHLALFMFNGKDKKHSLYPALFLSAGLLLTTSGMGIAAVGALWVMYFFMRDEKNDSLSLKNIFRPVNLRVIVVFIIVIVLALIFVPFLRNAVSRIFIPEREGGSTAISGRVKKALEFLATMPQGSMLFGVKDYIKGVYFNVPGLVDIFYRHGIIGTILTYSIYIMGLFKSKLPNVFVCLGVIATSLFSIHTHATVGMMYFILLIMSGWK